MSMKVIDTASRTKAANAARVNIYTIYTNKYNEHLPNKPTTCLRDIQVWEYTYTSASYGVLEKART